MMHYFVGLVLPLHTLRVMLAWPVRVIAMCVRQMLVRPANLVFLTTVEFVNRALLALTCRRKPV